MVCVCVCADGASLGGKNQSSIAFKIAAMPKYCKQNEPLANYPRKRYIFAVLVLRTTSVRHIIVYVSSQLTNNPSDRKSCRAFDRNLNFQF